MTRSTFMKLGLATLTVVAAGALGFASTQESRPDCPGKIVCPITGELICADQCPNAQANRADSLDQRVSPQTDELFSQKPLSWDGATEDALPPCCAKKS